MYASGRRGYLGGFAQIRSPSVIVDNAALRTPLPSTAAECKAAMGLATSVAFYRFDLINSGSALNLGDSGTATLTVAGTPATQKLVSGMAGAHFAASGDTYAADVHDTAANSFLGAVRFALVSDPSGAQHGVIGRSDGGFANGWNLYLNDSGDLLYYVDGAGATAFTGTIVSAIAPVGGAPVDLVFQFDRSGADPVMRFRWSRNGSNVGSTSVTMASLGSLTGAGQSFGVGDFHAGFTDGAGGWVQFAALGIGTQAEGATKALDASIGLGFE